MISNPTLISVIIPVYNGEKYLSEAIESVRQQQSQGLIEIIVVDDGSIDGTREIATSFMPQVRYSYQINQGPSAARNRGLGLARGEIIALLDCDDIWPSDKLAVQLPHFVADPNVEIVLGNTQHFRTVRPRDGHQEVVDYAKPFFIIQLGCALFRRSVFDKVGLFDASLRYGEDLDWLLRARETEVAVKYLNETTILYRRHAGNMTKASGHTILSLMALMKMSLDRRRHEGREQVPLPHWFTDETRY